MRDMVPLNMDGNERKMDEPGLPAWLSLDYECYCLLFVVCCLLFIVYLLFAYVLIVIRCEEVKCLEVR